MKKTILFIAMALMMAATGFSQNYEYNKDYKYSFFSNWSIGASGIVSKTMDFQDWNPGQGLSFGAEVRATKRVGTIWNLRYIAEVPGIYTKPNDEGIQYDRYGKAVAGVSLNFIKNMYLFADAGVSVNPSAKLSGDWNSLFGLAGQAGIGFNTNGKVGKLYVELGADCIQNSDIQTAHQDKVTDWTVPSTWSANLFGKVGYAFNLGVTRKDKQNLDDLYNQKERISQLEHENEHCNSKLDYSYKVNGDLAETLNKATTLCERLERELTECRDSKVRVVSSRSEGAEKLFDIYFEYGSFCISELENDKIKILAERITEQGGNYTVDGYCSKEGSDEYNQTLSEKRAEAVVNALVKAGVDKDRLTTVGHGKSTEYGDGSSPMNRRVSLNRN